MPAAWVETTFSLLWTLVIRGLGSDVGWMCPVDPPGPRPSGSTGTYSTDCPGPPACRQQPAASGWPSSCLSQVASLYLWGLRLPLGALADTGLRLLAQHLGVLLTAHPPRAQTTRRGSDRRAGGSSRRQVDAGRGARRGATRGDVSGESGEAVGAPRAPEEASGLKGRTQT